MQDEQGAYLLLENPSSEYPVIKHGNGVYVYDENGKKYLDGIGGIHVVSIGHGVNEIAEAVAKQMKSIAFVNRRLFLNEPALKLASFVVNMATSNMSNVYFVSGGSESNEMAYQIMYQYHRKKGNNGKRRVVGRWHSYHGFTIATESMGGHLRHRRKLPYLLDFPHIQPPHCYRCPYNLKFPSCALKCATELRTLIEQEGPDTIGAFIAEPIIGSTGGAITPPTGYYQVIREICDEYDILFIADEVITGFGRTGANFGINWWDTEPDIITSGKGLSSGYAPIGSVIVSEKVNQVLKQGDEKVALRLTYSSNPIACATALAVQKYIQQNNLLQNCVAMGAYLKNKLNLLAKKTSCIGDVRGEGLLLAIELVSEKETKLPFPRKLKIQERIVREALNMGLVLVGGTGTGNSLEGDHLLITPPFTISETECDQLIEILGLAITRVLKTL